MSIQKANMTRRQALGRAGAAASALASPAFFVRNAWAQGKAISIGIWGGTQGEYIRKAVLPAFESDFGCKGISGDLR